MKHKIGFNALDRRSSERKALKRSMVTSLLRYERIETTKAKALEIRKLAEKLITRAKEDSVHNRRIASKTIYDQAVVVKLFTEIGPMFKDRKGGYTRILKTGWRQGDAAELVLLELVEKTPGYEKKKEERAENKEAKAAKKNGTAPAPKKTENKATKQHAASQKVHAGKGTAKATGVRKTMAGGNAGGGDK